MRRFALGIAAPTRPHGLHDDRDARMAWWREARFGMFIHWGLYAVPAGDYNGKRSKDIGEWIMSWANIPRADYEQFAPQFNPVKFDADAWVRTAKDAGMKYIVITSKHHDGFAMFDSEVSDYDIVDSTPFKQDPMRALADEAQAAGHQVLLLPLDHGLAPSRRSTWTRRARIRRPATARRRCATGRKQEYVDYMKAQLRELITQYDPAVLWFDGEWVDWWTEEDGQELYAYVREPQARAS